VVIRQGAVIVNAIPTGFPGRHIGPGDEDIEKMLRVVSASDLDDLTRQAVPASVLAEMALDLPPALGETETIELLTGIAASNRVVRSLIGMGYAESITPPVIQRNVLENPSWYTAYTPYQAEISQGRLEALLNFQTMVSELTGMEVANASLLDEATAAAEAMAMAVRSTSRHRFVVDPDTHPQTITVMVTRAEPLGVSVEVVDPAEVDLSDVAGVLLQYPGSSGRVRDWRSLVSVAHEQGALVVVAADPLALVLLEPPGSWGADVVVGNTQRFGVPLGFGGPHAAYIATNDRLVRTLPGRLVGVSVDAAGRPGLRLALQTREQHIRRERATSNVCTAQVLLAVMAAMYASWHGPEGLTEIAERVHALASRLRHRLAAGGVSVRSDTWFDTIVIEGDADQIVARALDAGFNLRRLDSGAVGVTIDEVSDDAEIDRLLTVFAVAGTGSDTPVDGIPAGLRRSTPPLSHPVFTMYRSEHEMLRYLRRLSDKDLALDRSMIPLGSCTMKLNPTTAMVPITWPEFSRIHPLAPVDQASGYRRIIADLEQWLAAITGYDAVSLQPNAGSQGEFAGLLAIRAYHRARGNHERTVCLIPSSAHGTNAASAVMAGMEVVVVACDDHGNVSVDDLREKIGQHRDRVAALMVTYPSTHGVFEGSIGEMCDLIHEAGGQVYVDGANLNALVGVARPGDFGADVSHLNLHKTFTIPHGGGGPGVGPIGVKAHLAPYLPGDPLIRDSGAVSAAMFGSAGILPIPWAYMRMMGSVGMRTATQVAILSANYLAERLDPSFPVLYRGANGRVAHECIIDIRPLTKTCGVTAEDVAKRLADYGFHAPTLSFPVAGTLMIEPTESESLAELDRFCEAMEAIRAEIRRVEEGEWPVEDSPLRHAPHTVEDLVGEWDRPYSRETAVFPVSSLRSRAYFPPVGRIDGATGDRHLICSCPPIEAYAGV
jgi:glycine dehydrogenase